MAMSKTEMKLSGGVRSNAFMTKPTMTGLTIFVFSPPSAKDDADLLAKHLRYGRRPSVTHVGSCDESWSVEWSQMLWNREGSATW